MNNYKLIFGIGIFTIFFSCRNESKFKSNANVQEPKPAVINNADVYVAGIESPSQTIVQSISSTGALNIKFDAVGTKSINTQGVQAQTTVHAVFAMDVSGSMQEFLQETKTQINRVASALNADHINLNVSSLGFIDSFAEVARNNNPFRSISNSAQLRLFENDLNDLKGDFSENRDYAEGGLYAISEAIKKLETTGSKDEVKLIFYVSDAAAHNGSLESKNTRGMKRDCDLNPVANKLKSFANTLSQKDNLYFYYSVKPWDQSNEPDNLCFHTNTTIQNKSAAQQMQELMNLTGLKGGSIDGTGFFSRWPATNTVLVDSLVNAIKKSVSSVQGQDYCYAKSAKLISGTSSPITLWQPSQMSDILSLQQSTNKVEIANVAKKYNIDLNKNSNLTIDVQRCCVSALSQTSQMTCKSEYTQSIKVNVQNSSN